MTTATKTLGTVHFDLENLGTEIWLVSNPAETKEAYDDAVARGDGQDENMETVSPLDQAADVAQDCIVLAAHWGSDIPANHDASWNADLLARVQESDRAEVAELIAD